MNWNHLALRIGIAFWSDRSVGGIDCVVADKRKASRSRPARYGRARCTRRFA